jgi:hypothetical protein
MATENRQRIENVRGISKLVANPVHFMTLPSEYQAEIFLKCKDSLGQDDEYWHKAFLKVGIGIVEKDFLTTIRVMDENLRSALEDYVDDMDESSKEIRKVLANS